MRHPIRILLMLLAVAITTSASVAYAQTELVSNVPFAFKVGKVDHPAGTYTLRTNDADMTVWITPANGKANIAVVETRLGSPEPALTDGKLVFDKLGDQYFLSELWTPGDEGFLLHVTKAKHSHVAVKLEKKR